MKNEQPNHKGQESARIHGSSLQFEPPKGQENTSTSPSSTHESDIEPTKGDWEIDFDNRFMPREKDEECWAGDKITPRLQLIITEIKAFIRAQKDKSYEEGAKEFQKMGAWYDKGFEAGRMEGYTIEGKAFDAGREAGKREGLQSIIDFVLKQKNYNEDKGVNKHIDGHELICWVQNELSKLK